MMEEQYLRDLADSRRFPCPSCNRIVTGLVRAPGFLPQSSKTHCCNACAAGREHDDYWCGGTPDTLVHRVQLDLSSQAAGRAHYVLFEPDWQKVKAPVPAVLFLHGAFTYLWPETLWQEASVLVDHNPKAQECVVIAPYATIGEPLAVISESRLKADRFGRQRPYVESFHAERTWECFVKACRQLGPDRVDFQRLCVTGYSMGAQATWEIAARFGTHIAAVAPMAGRANWRALGDISDEQILKSLGAVRLRQFAVQMDQSAYSWSELQWVAENARQLPRNPQGTQTYQVTQGQYVNATKEAVVHEWSPDLQLTLFRGYGGDKVSLEGCEQHNCWDTVFAREQQFGLFRWFASSRNPKGAELAKEGTNMRGVIMSETSDNADGEADSVQESLLARACRRRDLFQVQALLVAKADANERNAVGETPLLEAAAGGDLNVVALLLGWGADVNTRARQGFEADAERELSPQVRSLFGIFSKKGGVLEKRAVLESLPVPLDPGALAKVRTKLSLGGRNHGGVRQGGMAPAEALQKSNKRESEAAADHDVVLHVADTMRPVLMLNPLWQKPTATVVLFHGVLQSGQMMERMARDLARALPHVRFIAPTAPSLPTHGGIGPSWFSIVDRVPAGTQYRRFHNSYEEIMDLLKLEKEAGILPERIVLAGFSMGGYMAGMVALMSYQKFAGLVLMGSMNLSIGLKSGNFHEGTRGLPVLQVHGEDDESVPIEYAMESADMLQELGCDLEFSTYSKVGHNVSERMLGDIRSWLVEHLPVDPNERKVRIKAAEVQPDVAQAVEMEVETPSSAPNAVEAPSSAPEIAETPTSAPDVQETPSYAPDAVLTPSFAPEAEDKRSDASATGHEQVSKIPEHPTRLYRMLPRMEEALAQMLAHDLPRKVCEEVLLRFNYDADAALGFLLDTEEGEQLIVEAEKIAADKERRQLIFEAEMAADAERFNSSKSTSSAQAFDISTPPDPSDNTMEQDAYDIDDWGSYEFGLNMPKAERQTSTSCVSSTSYIDLDADISPESVEDFSRQESDELYSSALMLLLTYELPEHACRAALKRFGYDTDAALEFLLNTSEGNLLCLTSQEPALESRSAPSTSASKLEAPSAPATERPETVASISSGQEVQITREQPGVGTSTFEIASDRSSSSSRQEADANTEQPGAASVERTTKTALDNTFELHADNTAFARGQTAEMRGEQPGEACSTLESDAASALSSSGEKTELSRENPGTFDSEFELKVSAELSPRNSGIDTEISREQLGADEVGVESNPLTSEQGLQMCKEQSRALDGASELSGESAPCIAAQDAETSEFELCAESTASASGQEAETSREQTGVLESAVEFGPRSPRTISGKLGASSGASDFVEHTSGTAVSSTSKTPDIPSTSEQEAQNSRDQPEVAGSNTPSISRQEPENSREQPEAFGSKFNDDAEEVWKSRENPGVANSTLELGADSKDCTSQQDTEASRECAGVVGSTSDLATESDHSTAGHKGELSASIEKMDTSIDQPRMSSTSEFSVNLYALRQLLAFDLPEEACEIALRQFGNDADSALDFLMDTEEGLKLCESVLANAAVAEAAADKESTAESSVSAERSTGAGVTGTGSEADTATKAEENLKSSVAPTILREVEVTSTESEAGASTSSTEAACKAEARASSDAEEADSSASPEADVTHTGSVAGRTHGVSVSSAGIAGRDDMPSTTKAGVEAEAKQRAEEKTRIQAELAAQQKAQEEEAERLRKAKEEEEARIQEEAKARQKAEEEARLQGKEAQQKAREEELLRLQAEAEAKQKAEEKARIQAELAAQQKAQEEEAERLRKAKEEEEARLKKEAKARQKAEEEARLQAKEARRKAREEELLRLQAEAEAKKKAEEKARMQAELAAQQKAQEEEAERLRKAKKEEEARLKKAAEARQRADKEAERLSALEADITAHTVAEADTTSPDIKAGIAGIIHEAVGTTPEDKPQAAVCVSPEQPLVLAAKLGNLKEVKRLIRKGADIDARGLGGETPLFAAVRRGHTSMVAALLLKQADPSIRSHSSILAADVATQPEIRWLCHLASGHNLGVQEQRCAFAALDDVVPYLFEVLLKDRGVQIAVSNVTSELEWDLVSTKVVPAPAA